MFHYISKWAVVEVLITPLLVVLLVYHTYMPEHRSLPFSHVDHKYKICRSDGSLSSCVQLLPWVLEAILRAEYEVTHWPIWTPWMNCGSWSPYVWLWGVYAEEQKVISVDNNIIIEILLPHRELNFLLSKRAMPNEWVHVSTSQVHHTNLTYTVF